MRSFWYDVLVDNMLIILSLLYAVDAFVVDGEAGMVTRNKTKCGRRKVQKSFCGLEKKGRSAEIMGWLVKCAVFNHFLLRVIADAQK